MKRRDGIQLVNLDIGMHFRNNLDSYIAVEFNFIIIRYKIDISLESEEIAKRNRIDLTQMMGDLLLNFLNTYLNGKFICASSGSLINKA